MKHMILALVAVLLSLSFSHTSAGERTPVYSGTVFVTVESTICYDPSPDGFIPYKEELLFGTELFVFEAQPWDGYIMVDYNPGFGESCLVDPNAVDKDDPRDNYLEDKHIDEEVLVESTPSEPATVDIVADEAVPVRNPEAFEAAEPSATEASTPVPIVTNVQLVTGLPSTGDGPLEDRLPQENTGSLIDFGVGLTAFLAKAVAVIAIVILIWFKATGFIEARLPYRVE